jgi:hypothetical protein
MQSLTNKYESQQIIYPQSFIDHCKRLYPDWINLYKAIEEGSPIVVSYLDDASVTPISPEELLSCTTLEEVHAKANLLLEKIKLYEQSQLIVTSERQHFSSPHLAQEHISF